MQTKGHQVDGYLKGNTLHQIVLAYGPDQGLVSERIAALIKKRLGEKYDPFSLQVFDSDQIAADPGLLADETGGLGLFGSERVIRIRLNGNRSITQPVKILFEGLSDDITVLIEAGDLKKNHAIRSLVEKSPAAMALPCYADDVRSLNALIDEEMRANNITLSSEARAALLPLLGENRQTSRNELKKLALFAADKGTIDLADVTELIGDASMSMVDETIDLIMAGQTSKGITNFNRGLDLGGSSFQTLHALQRYLSQLQVLRHQIDNGGAARETIDRARPPIYFKRKPAVTNHLTRWNRAHLERAQKYLLTTTKETREKASLADVITANLLIRLSKFASQRRK